MNKCPFKQVECTADCRAFLMNLNHEGGDCALVWAAVSIARDLDRARQQEQTRQRFPASPPAPEVR
jgi:hypothetical protein